MNTKRLLLLFVVIVLMFPFFQILANPPVTFDLLLSFDYPGGEQSNAFAINDRGDVAGSFLIGGLVGRGFVRFGDGHFSGPLVEPNDTGNYTVLSGINNLGTASGFYIAGASGYQGFLVSGFMFTEVALDAEQTVVEKVNDAGNFCGY